MLFSILIFIILVLCIYNRFFNLHFRFDTFIIYIMSFYYISNAFQSLLILWIFVISSGILYRLKSCMNWFVFYQLTFSILPNLTQNLSNSVCIQVNRFFIQVLLLVLMLLEVNLAIINVLLLMIHLKSTKLIRFWYWYWFNNFFFFLFLLLHC